MKRLSRILRTIRHSQAVSQSAVFTAGSMATGVLAAIALIYISRNLGPQEFGIFSVGIAVMMIVAKVGDLGLSTIITRQLPRLQQDPILAKEFLAQVMKWKLGMTLIGLSALLLLIPFAERWLNYPHPGLLALALFGAIGLIMYEYVVLVLSALHKFQWVTVLNILQASLKVLAFLTLGVLGLATAVSVSFFYYLAPLLATFLVAAGFREWFFLRPMTASAAVRQEVRKHIVHAGLGMLAMTLISNVDVLFVQRYLTSFETGIYSAAMRIALFVTFISAAVGGVLNNRVARYQDAATLRLYLKKALLIVLVAGAGFLFFLPLARYILIYTIGPEFLPGLIPMIILVLNAFLAFAVVPFISFFFAVDHPKYFSAGGFLQVAVICLGNILFLPSYGLEAAAWSRVAATSLHFVFTLIYIRHALRQLSKPSLKVDGVSATLTSSAGRGEE